MVEQFYYFIVRYGRMVAIVCVYSFWGHHKRWLRVHVTGIHKRTISSDGQSVATVRSFYQNTNILCLGWEEGHFQYEIVIKIDRRVKISVVASINLLITWIFFFCITKNVELEIVLFSNRIWRDNVSDSDTRTLFNRLWFVIESLFLVLI